MKIEGGEAEINEGQGVNEGKSQRRTKKKEADRRRKRKNIDEQKQDSRVDSHD